jgi:hypothetical protein
VADAESADAEKPAAVAGQRNFIYISEGAPVRQGEDLTTATLDITASDGAHTVTGAADGTFTTTDVLPVGAYTLHFDDGYYVPSWVVTSSKTPDLSLTYLGRSNATAVTMAGTDTAGTRLQLTLNNLDNWNAMDDLEVYVGNTGDFVTTTTTTLAPSAGMLNGFVVNFTTGDFLVDGASGDVVYVSQLKNTTSGGGATYKVLDRYYASTGVSVTDGNATSISDSFSTVNQNKSFDLKWNRSAYETIMPSMGPSLADAGDWFNIYAQPGGLRNGVLFSNADVLIYHPVAAGTDVDVGTVAWGNPYPSSWGVIASVERDYLTTYSDGGTNSWDAYASVVQNYDAANLGAISPFVPTLGPVSAVMLDSTDASAPQNITSATPTISWTAPTLGRPTDYVVAVYLLDPANTAPAMMAYLSTKGTSIQIPAGVLTTGSLYYVRVTAYNRAGVDTDQTPYQDGTPELSTDYLTNLLTATF